MDIMTAMKIVWYVLVAVAIFCAAIRWLKSTEETKERQIKDFKQWLRWAVAIAESELGSGTGVLKLRYVYDLAATRFPMIVRVISFEDFSNWVDDALTWLELAADQQSIAEYLDKDRVDEFADDLDK